MATGVSVVFPTAPSPTTTTLNNGTSAIDVLTSPLAQIILVGEQQTTCVHRLVGQPTSVGFLKEAMEIFRSRDKNCDACRSVALMRNSRGGYPLGKDDQLARERRTSRTEKI